MYGCGIWGNGIYPVARNCLSFRGKKGGLDNQPRTGGSRIDYGVLIIIYLLYGSEQGWGLATCQGLEYVLNK